MMIGRAYEQKLLNHALTSDEAEFVVIYGRRRVGKTHLVREFYANKKCRFLHTTGIYKATLLKQLTKFIEALSHTFLNDVPLQTPTSWDEAFSILHQQIIHSQEKTVIFLDELPWLATKKSRLLETIDYYWNRHWSAMPHVTLIACGSSASWLIKKIIYNKGGLHNRTTIEIKLEPFTLLETRKYLSKNKVKLNNQQILSLYMA